MTTEQCIQLSQSALQSLVTRWLKRCDGPEAWSPREPIAILLQEASEIAALIDASKEPRLLPDSDSRELRELTLAAETLHIAFQRARGTQSEKRKGEEVRQQARFWVSEISAGLRFLASGREESRLRAQLAQLSGAEGSDDGLALRIDILAELAGRYQSELGELRIAPELIEQGSALAASMRQLSASRMLLFLDRAETRRARNALLFELSQRIRKSRTTLRFVHRADPIMLKRIASEHLRKKRKKARQAKLPRK